MLFDRISLKDTSLGKEMDVYIPFLRIGIEADGYRWHTDREENDIAKTKFFSKHDITIIRLREQPLPLLGPFDVPFKKTMSHKHEVISSLINKIEQVTGLTIRYDSTNWLNDNEYHQMIQQ